MSGWLLLFLIGGEGGGKLGNKYLSQVSFLRRECCCFFCIRVFDEPVENLISAAKKIWCSIK